MFDTSTNIWLSPIPDMKEKRSSCQAVLIGPKIYVMGGYNDSTTLSSIEMFDLIISLLYPTNDNYVTVKGVFRYCKVSALINFVVHF